jgi:hypothetical protein
LELIRPGRLLRAHGPRIVACSFGILMGLLAPRAQGQEVLYGMNDVGQPGGPDEIVQIDRQTGVATRLHVFSTGFNFLESLTFDARENVFWTTNDGVLVRIQPTTYVTQVIGPTGVSDIDGLAVQPSTGALFGITYGGNDLLRIDKLDAGTSIVNGSLEQGSRLEDLAFDSTGRLYVLTSRNLVEVDQNTGQRISKVRLSGATSLEGLVWDAQNGAFLSAADRGIYKDLVKINRTTGEVTFLSATLHSGFRDIEALTFAPGTPIVPVAMEALEATRSAAGAELAWAARRPDLEFVVERALDVVGPWTEVGRAAAPAGGRGDAWRYEFRDAGAAEPSLEGTALVYRVGAADEAGAWAWIGFELAAGAAPRPVVLGPNFPNPFNPTTAFQVRLAAPEDVRLVLFDAAGRRVRELRADLGAGTHALVWDGRDAFGRAAASGVYPYVISAGGAVRRGRAVLVR